jgi:phosphoribosylamine--glycine ligase
MVNVLLIGNGAREHALAEAIMQSSRQPRLFSYMKTNNPGIALLSEKIFIGSYSDLAAVNAFAKECRIDFAIVGPEDPLNNGVVDSLKSVDIPAVGPTKSLARLETSKSFTRHLVEKYHIQGNPKFRTFSSMEGIEAFLDELDGIVVKPDGLTGGKGVMVQGDHFQTKAEALDYCRQVLKEHPSVTIDERRKVRNSLSSVCATGKRLWQPRLFRITRGALWATRGQTPAGWVLIPVKIIPCPSWTGKMLQKALK